jgi:hypothetical protein
MASGLLGHICQLCPIRATICYFVRNDEMKLGLNRDLHIVADHTKAAATWERGYPVTHKALRGIHIGRAITQLVVRVDMITLGGRVEFFEL